MPLKPALHIRPKSILFATDLTPECNLPLRHAIALARHYDAALHLVHIVSSLGFDMAGADAIYVAEEAAERDMRSLEAKLAGNGSLSGVRHDCAIRSGDIWPQLESLIDADAADLLVIGTHGRHGIGRLLLGSVAELIFRRAECPVVTVGPCFGADKAGSQRDPKPILWATDFQPASLQALPYAIDFARERGSKLVLLHVIPEFAPTPETGWFVSSGLRDIRTRAKDSAIERLNALARAHDLLGGDFDGSVRFGDPAEEIVKLARELRADGIAMGLHRCNQVQAVSHFRRTVAHEVVCQANCAVLTVRG